jgi:hypothetical protein
LGEKRTLTNRCSSTSIQTKTAAAWRRFISCVELLPPDQAMPLWQAVQAQVTTGISAADYFADDL